MAAGQLPRHDFAPAWLKIPTNENAAWRQGTGDRLYYQHSGAERSLGRHGRSNAGGRGGPMAYDDMAAPPPHAFHHPQPFSRPRFYSDYHDDYDVTVNGVGPRSSSRPGHSSRSHVQANGTFPEPPYLARRSAAMVNGSHASSKKPQRPKDGRSGSVSGAGGGGPNRKSESTKAAATGATPTLDDEFPSLNGDATAESSRPTTSKVSSVWDSPSRQSRNIGRSSSSNADAGHKALVLKTGNAKRLATQSSSGGNVKLTSDSKESGTNAPAEGLSTCLVTHPKNIGDKKSNFLRSLRCESHESDTELNGFELTSTSPTSPEQDCDHSVFCELAISNCCDNSTESNSHDEKIVNACSKPIEQILSSSHEAEQRLLREMGWKEVDDEDEQYEITEADVREFENLRRQLQVNISSIKKSNGFAKVGGAGRSLSFPIYIHDVPLPDLDADSDASDSSDDGFSNNVGRNS